MRNHKVEIICSVCFKSYIIMVNSQDLYDYVHCGKLAQNAFPYLSPAERELIISQTCGPCFDNLFKEPI